MTTRRDEHGTKLTWLLGRWQKIPEYVPDRNMVADGVCPECCIELNDGGWCQCCGAIWDEDKMEVDE